MIRTLIASMMLFTLLALPALAQVTPGKPIAPAVRNFSPRYSPDGKWVAYFPQKDSELWVMDANGMNARVLLTGNKDAKDKPGYLPYEDVTVSDFIWASGSLSMVCRVRYKSRFRSGREHRDSFRLSAGLIQVQLDGIVKWIIKDLSPLRGAAPRAYTISPDGKSLVVFYGAYFRTLPPEPDKPVEIPEHRYTVTGFRIFPLGNDPAKPANTPAFISIVDYLCIDAFTGSDGRIYCSMQSWDKKNEKYNTGIYTVDIDGKVTPVVTTPDAIETSPALSPDGKRLAFLRRENRDISLIVLEMGGGNAETVALKNVVAYRWLPDGRILAATRTKITLGTLETSPMEVHDEFVVITPGAAKPELRVLLRVTAISIVSSQDAFFNQSADNAVDLTYTRDYPIRSDDKFAPNSSPFFLPDVSPDGKRLVYEKDGTLYLTEMHAKPAEAK